MAASLHKEIGYDIMAFLEDMLVWSELTDVNEKGCYQRLLLKNGCSVQYTKWRYGESPFYIILYDARGKYIFELDLTMLIYQDDVFQWHLRKPKKETTLAALTHQLGATQSFPSEYVSQVKAQKQVLAPDSKAAKSGFLFLADAGWDELTAKLLDLIIAVYQAHDEALEVESTLPGEAENDQAEFENLRRRIRRGQQKLKRKLIHVYDSTCAITGAGPIEVLEAAHIFGHADSGINDSCNALLLRADIHILFDKNLLKINPKNFKIVLDNTLKKTDYWQLNGKKLRKRNDGLLPSVEYLEKRWFGESI